MARGKCARRVPGTRPRDALAGGAPYTSQASSLLNLHQDTMVFALASRTLRSSSLRPAMTQLAGARRGYAEAVGDKLRLSFVVPHSVRNRTR